MSCAILFILPRFSVTSACNPSHHYRHVMTEEGKHPILYPVNDYSSCCPVAEQRISHVQVTNVTIPTGGSQWVPVFTYGSSSSVSASMKDNQLVLNVRSVCWVYSLLECAAMLYMYFIYIVASRLISKERGNHFHFAITCHSEKCLRKQLASELVPVLWQKNIKLALVLCWCQGSQQRPLPQVMTN